MSLLVPKRLDNQCLKVKLVIKYIDPVNGNLPCLEVLAIFSRNSEIFALAVVNNKNIPIGIIDRHTFVESFLEPSQLEKYNKKKISEFMIEKPILVDINSTIDDVSEIIIETGMQKFVNGFVITESGLYAGVASSQIGRAHV